MPYARHGVLTANTVATVEAPAGWGAVEVLNHDSANRVYVTDDGTNPTVGGPDTYVVPSGGSLLLSPQANRALTVKLIGAAASPYSVTAT